MSDVEVKQRKLVDPMVPQVLQINKINWETDDVYTIHLKPEGMNDLPYKFLPGQFNMLYVFGIGEAAISISSSPFKPSNIKHTIHKVGAVTSVLSKLKAGDFVGLRGPFGSSWPVKEAIGKDVCIVTGGIGLAPLRPTIYSLLKNRKDYGKIHILYGARTPLDLVYRVELEEWEKQYDVEVLITVDKSDSSWKGNVGVVTNLFNYTKLDSNNTLTMVCGPEIMMKFTIEELQDIGIPDSSIYVSLERNMKCAVGFCGHCQYGPKFICKDGPVFNYPQIRHLFDKKEI